MIDGLCDVEVFGLSRLVNRPIQVIVRNGIPDIVVDADSSSRIIEVIDEWREMGNWIQGEPEHHVWRVVTDNNAIMDIEEVETKWSIYRILD